ncbi:MAG: arginase family protein [Pseudomonadales bacterium]
MGLLQSASRLAALAALCAIAHAAQAAVTVDVIKQPYGGSRNVPELSANPDYIHAAGLERLLEGWGATLVRPVQDIRLTADQERQYGAWNRMALANGNLAAAVREGRSEAALTVGLEANCNVLLGMLAGLKYDAGGAERRVGLVFIDAHGDFNVPETTLSGMLGGMPVAVAAGHALHNLRRTSGLEAPLPMSHILWGGVRDLDPLEADRFAEYQAQQFSVADIRARGPALREAFARLSDQVDAVYVHVDMDVLDPAEVPGHDLAVADGPTSRELADAIAVMFENPKTVALGIASTPAGALDPGQVSRQAALNLIEGAVRGVQRR